jgi:hypothetical protein
MIVFRPLLAAAASLLVHLGLAALVVVAHGWTLEHRPALVLELVEVEAPPPAPAVPDHARLAVDAAGRAIVLWEDSTAVRRRILLRSVGEGGRSLGRVRNLSQAIKAWAPAVAVAPDGFLVAWHEERFPAIRTVVQRIAAEEVRQ